MYFLASASIIRQRLPRRFGEAAETEGQPDCQLLRNSRGVGILGFPRSPGTYLVGPWVIDSIGLYRDPRTGTQYIGNWAFRGL